MYKTACLFVIITGFKTLTLLSQSGILSSQVGYDRDCPIRIIVRSDDPGYLSSDAGYYLVNSDGKLISGGKIKMGNK
jgi:hypothetical protein